MDKSIVEMTLSELRQAQQASRAERKALEIQLADDWLTKWLMRHNMAGAEIMTREDVVKALADYGTIWRS